MKKLLLFCLVGSFCLPVFSQNPIPKDVRPNPYLYVTDRSILIDRVYPHSEISPVIDDEIIICQTLHPDELLLSIENKTDNTITVMLKNGSLIINGTAYKVLYEMNGYLVNYPIELPPHSVSPGIFVTTSRAMFYPYRLKEAAKKYGIGAPEGVSHLTLEFPIMIDSIRRPYKLEYEIKWIDGKTRRKNGYTKKGLWYFRYNTENPMNL